MNIDYTVTALMFPAIPLLMAVYSNRFHTLSNLVRKLHDEHVYEKHIPPEWKKQFLNLSSRISLLRWTILFAAVGFLFNMLTVFALYLDKVLYHAAAGGLGQILCPWANALGAEVIGTVGSKIKEEIAKKNGCHHVINYSEKNFVEEVERIVGKNGIDVVYDGVGIKTFKGSIETLKIRGMMVAFGIASGYVDTIDVKKDINAKGLFFTRPSIAHYTIKRDELVESAKKVFEAVVSKKFKIEISKKYSLKDAAQAHKDLEARLLTGPAVIIP